MNNVSTIGSNRAMTSRALRHTVAGAVALAWMAAAPTVASGQNLLLNESFENPAFTGSHRQYWAPSAGVPHWTVSGFGNIVIHHAPDAGIDTGNPTFNFAHHGDNYLDLSGTGSQATISQSFQTVIGEMYELSFCIGASDDQLPAATIGVRLDGASPLLNTALTPPAPAFNIVWAPQSFAFVADATTTTLSFQGLSGIDDNASYVDSCSVVLVPAPGAAALVGLAGLIGLRRRR
ncbi:MAG: DUF642 domain-containing protein [Phycisphaerales bacterium]